MMEITGELGRPGVEPRSDEGPVVSDLLADLSEVWARLTACVADGHTLDAFLFAAGAVQIVEDHVQRDPLSVRRTASYLGGPAALPLTAIARSVDTARGLRPAHRRALAWCARTAAVRDELADAVVADGIDERASLRLDGTLASLRAAIDRLPAAASRQVIRLPGCFRGHGLLPADAVQLAVDYAPTADRREVLVVGVRTSGSYLGPLVAAALRARGLVARTASTRPGHPLLPADARALVRLRAAGGAVALVDDPPNSGRTLRRSARLLAEHGVAPDQLTLLLPLFGDAIPATLDGHRRVELPFRRWAVHAQLTPGALAATLASLWSEPVDEVHHIGPSDDDGGARHHITRVVRAVLRSGDERTVLVSGAGVGYLGRFALATAAAVPQHLPATYGFRDGLVYREWLRHSDRVRTPDTADAAAYARYVLDRATAMPGTEDRAADMAGRDPVWELASRTLQRGYGRFGVGLRLPLLDPTVRQLCHVERPSVIDGATGLGHWYRNGDRLLKVRADDLAFGNLDHTCYDSAYDLAGVDPGSSNGEFVAALRAAHPADAERFLLYELVHLRGVFGGRSLDQRAAARAVQRYLAGVLPSPTSPQVGPLCALDIDGVLESLAHGFPVVTPTALLAVRALEHHGFRPVPVTGRSLGEVRDRCSTLGLAGGVAEYGAVALDHRRNRVERLVSDADMAVLERLRAGLLRSEGVRVEEDHRFSVRARGPGPGWGAPAADVLEAALAGLGADRGRLRVVPGRYQTDVVAAAVDKGAGLTALARMLGEPDAPVPIRFAVGDTAADLPMFGVAQQAFAPANASPAVREAAVEVLRKPYAAGVAAAAARVIGHRPGGCAACRPAPQPRSTRLLLTVLDAPRSGRAGLPLAALRLASELAGVRQPPR